MKRGWEVDNHSKGEIYVQAIICLRRACHHTDGQFCLTCVDRPNQ